MKKYKLSDLYVEENPTWEGKIGFSVKSKNNSWSAPIYSLKEVMNLISIMYDVNEIKF